MLTSLLKEHPDLADRLRMLALYEARKCPVHAPLVAPPRTQNYALVGTAMDYLIRWELERRNPVAKDREWVAELALLHPYMDSTLGGGPPELTYDLIRTYRAVVDAAKLVHSEFVKMREVTAGQVASAATACLALARIDPLYRSGSLDVNVSAVNPLDIADLERLYEVTPWASIGGTPGMPVRLNPDFGRVSQAFRGMDADLVVGDTLIDFKTVKGFDLMRYLPQLLGYVAGSDRYRETEDSTFPRFERAGIHFVRHGVVVTFDLEPIRGNPEWDEAVSELFQTAETAFGTTVPTLANPIPEGGGWK